MGISGFRGFDLFRLVCLVGKSGFFVSLGSLFVFAMLMLIEFLLDLVKLSAF